MRIHKQEKTDGCSLEKVEGLVSSAILTDGRVGLIFDIHGIC
jgi:chemotaxis protein histidine kinase CheA